MILRKNIFSYLREHTALTSKVKVKSKGKEKITGIRKQKERTGRGTECERGLRGKI